MGAPRSARVAGGSSTRSMHSVRPGVCIEVSICSRSTVCPAAMSGASEQITRSGLARPGFVVGLGAGNEVKTCWDHPGRIGRPGLFWR
jgi:hypothetical protein